MNPKLKLFLRKCQFPLTLALGFFPILLVVNGIFVPELVSLCWIFPCTYLPLAIICMALPGKLRVALSLVGAALLCLPAAFLPGPAVRWVALCEGLFYAAVLFCSLPMAKWTEVDELSTGIMWTGMGLHLLAQVLVLVCKIYELPQLDAAAPWLTAGLVIYVLLSMLALNRRGLYHASTGRQAVPGAMRRKNLLLLLVFFGAAALVSLIPAAGELIRLGFATLVGLIMSLLMLLEPNAGELTETVPPETTLPHTTLPALPQSPGSPVASLILEILAYLMLIVTVIALAYFLWRKSKKWLPRLWGRLSRHLASSSEDYVDEITSTREFGIQEKRRNKDGQRPVSRLRQRALPPRQQIRSRYQAILRKHPEWAAGSTAREKLPASLSSLYERARYSAHPISEEEARKFRDDTKKM